MDIKVSLPKPDNVSGKGIKAFLRQMELSIHHLKKSFEEIEKEGDIENHYLTYRFPRMDLYEREQDKEGNVKVHVDEESDQMQDIEVNIGEI